MSYDLDCSQVPDRNFLVVGEDPHHFDGDGDGVGCEYYAPRDAPYGGGGALLKPVAPPTLGGGTSSEYDRGYEDGYEDGESGNDHGDGYEGDSEDYDSGYEDGYTEGREQE